MFWTFNNRIMVLCYILLSRIKYCSFRYTKKKYDTSLEFHVAQCTVYCFHALYVQLHEKFEWDSLLILVTVCVRINPSVPSGYYTYRGLPYTENLHSAFRAYLYVCTDLRTTSDYFTIGKPCWFCYRHGVFTVRYDLDLYIQFRLVLVFEMSLS
jgi:hypothetical protein